MELYAEFFFALETLVVVRLILAVILVVLVVVLVLILVIVLAVVLILVLILILILILIHNSFLHFNLSQHSAVSLVLPKF